MVYYCLPLLSYRGIMQQATPAKSYTGFKLILTAI